MTQQYVNIEMNTKQAISHRLSDDASMQEKVIDVLKQIYDPEIPLNLYDLGLIYGVDVDEHNNSRIVMTLTTPHCPVAESMPAQVRDAVSSIPDIGEVDVELTWDPPWTQDRLTDEAKLELGLL